ncbi:MAG: transporter [Gammaproteobacteria bacterium]
MKKCTLVLAYAALLSTSHAYAHVSQLAGNTSPPISPDSHAPIGVMGDHLHKQGEWMISYRFMQMRMENNIQGSHALSPDEIVTQISNPNAPPPTVRVVPVNMTTDMHMLGAMYAPSDTVTLMLMLNYLQKEMDHKTYMGMTGSTQLGEFTTRSNGLGDTKVTALWRLLDQNQHKIHLNLGLSLPTGSTDETDEVLSPMNTRPTLRLPYAMQLGSGSYDLEPGITYTGHQNRLGWGAQFLATVRLGDNDEDYNLGDKQHVTGWGTYRVSNWSSLSLRLSYTHEATIDGIDSHITAPVTTANPENYGGNRWDLGFGVNVVGQDNALRGHRLALEYQSTIDQDANGVQLEMQSMLTLGYQYAF